MKQGSFIAPDKSKRPHKVIPLSAFFITHSRDHSWQKACVCSVVRSSRRQSRIVWLGKWECEEEGLGRRPTSAWPAAVADWSRSLRAKLPSSESKRAPPPATEARGGVRGQKHHLQAAPFQSSVQILASPLNNCITLSKAQNLRGDRFPVYKWERACISLGKVGRIQGHHIHRMAHSRLWINSDDFVSLWLSTILGLLTSPTLQFETHLCHTF